MSGWATSRPRLAGRTPDYLVVHHMEPDHSAGIAAFAERYPEAQIVASAMAFKMMAAYFGTDFAGRRVIVKEGSTLELGDRSLTFVGAPQRALAEVMFSYVPEDKALFSADGFGKFGALDVEDPEGWACEARRYYFGIVGKFGKNVQAVLKKAAGLDIEHICPLHGPVLSENLGYYHGPLQHLVFLRAGRRGRDDRLLLRLRPHEGRRAGARRGAREARPDRRRVRPRPR